MRNWGALTSEVSSVVSPIVRLVRAAAASDPDMAALLHASNDIREDAPTTTPLLEAARLPARRRYPGPGDRHPVDLHL